MHKCLHTVAELMNRLGTDGCKASRTELVAQLRGLYDEKEVADVVSKAKVDFPIDRDDVFGSIFDEAVRRVEAVTPPISHISAATELREPGDCCYLARWANPHQLTGPH
jgi:hypothetical protein